MHYTQPSTVLRWLFIPFVAVMAAMYMVGAPLKTEAAPNGIVTFELCALASGCERILQTWTPRQREYAMLGLGLDYLYMVLYPAVIASALLTVAKTLPRVIQGSARLMAWMLVLAGLADAFENYFLIQMLITGENAGNAMPAAAFASGKFVVIALALALLAVAAVLNVVRRRDA